MFFVVDCIRLIFAYTVSCVSRSDVRPLSVCSLLQGKVIRIGTGTIVDATIIHAPSPTKNSSAERDPEMHQTRKGRPWYFGAKAHIGVDAKEGHVHSVCTSAASVSDVHIRYAVHLLEWDWQQRIAIPGNTSAKYCYDADAVSLGIEDHPVTFFAFEWLNPRLGKVIRELRLCGTSGFRGGSSEFDNSWRL